MSAGKGIFESVPDMGITRKVPREGGLPQWCVDLSIYSLTTAQARQVSAELLNSADMADQLNAKIASDSAGAA